MGFRSIGSAGTLVGGNIVEMQDIDIDGYVRDTAPAPRSRVTPRSLSSARINNSDRMAGKGMTELPMTMEQIVQDEGQKNRALLTELDEKNTRSYRNEKILLAGAQFGLDIMNASTQYRNIEGAARFNIMQSRNQAADALYRGRQAALDTQLEGVEQGQDAVLALAAQGQDVQGAGVQRVVRSYEGIAEQNAAIVEANAAREALGFKLQDVATGYELETARINRNQQYISSALNFGAQAAGAFV